MADVEEEEDQILGLLCDVLAAGAQQQKETAPSPRESQHLAPCTPRMASSAITITD